MTKVKMVRNVLEKNDKLAEQIREMGDNSKTVLFNMMGTPGAGKTTLLESIIPALKEDYKMGVVEGDVATANDADRIAALDVATAQVNTDRFGGTCHLGSEMVKPALEKINYDQLDIVIIENIGNLICPAHFDIGAHYNIAVVSITEGVDKPAKYPLMFRNSKLAILNKIDLLEHLNIDIEEMVAGIKQINPDIDILKMSALQPNDGIALNKWIKKRGRRK
ncbi:MAG: hydrogenase nickel incorporation protein HypB [Candidatus Marinimicrobia bacterium]|nr:hydrogenase nickel incorporation protein HypB [Candidatus Neomarinimicrobiota bacterium]